MDALKELNGIDSARKQAKIIKAFYMTVCGYSPREISASLNQFDSDKVHNLSLIHKYIKEGVQWYADNAIQDIELLKNMRIAQLSTAFEALWEHARELIENKGSTSDIASVFKEIRMNIATQSKIEGSEAPQKIEANIDLDIKLNDLSKDEKYKRFEELSNYYKQFEPTKNMNLLAGGDDDNQAK